jgi:hypothetical protein
MTSLTVAGGVYHEFCIWPEWNCIWGSGGRAAAALSGHVDQVILKAYASERLANAFRPSVLTNGFNFEPVSASQTVSFEYVHCLSTPNIRPNRERIIQHDPFSVSDKTVLRFGMIEGNAVVDSEFCVYDPQSAYAPEAFSKNGSKASRLAIVANRNELQLMTGHDALLDGARSLMSQGAEIVVVKCGANGALLFEGTQKHHIPAYYSQQSWTVGSGDVFAAIFAARWAVHGDAAVRAAEFASKAVAIYTETMSLPAPLPANLEADSRKEVSLTPGKVYLAGPFFSISQRWLIEEARNSLLGCGLEVFSPLHDVGRGPGNIVGPADLHGLHECDRVFAVLDGLDSGTIFEVGYARHMGLPVYALAQAVPAEDLKMMEGSQCRIYYDFATAIHQTAWKL